jgi:DNA-binding CsgD family transcriptional regulator
VLDLLALVGPTRLVALEAMTDMACLERLEDEGLVTLHPGETLADDRLALTHPLLGDALRQTLPKLRARSLLAAHADRVEALDCAHLDDALHVATWRLEAGVGGDPDTLEAAAALARYAPDLDLTTRLAREAARVRPTARAAVLLGEALYQQCRWDEAEDVLAAAAQRCSGLVELAPVLAVRSINLLFGLDRPDEAVQLLEDALAGAPASEEGSEARARRELRSRLALVQLFRGRPVEALETLGPEPPTTGQGQAAARDRVVWAMAGAPALALTGSTERAVALAREAYRSHLEIGGEIAYSGPEIHVLNLCLALTEHGELDEASALAEAGYEGAIAAGSTIGQTWFTLHLARLDHLRGRVASAERWVRETLALCPPGTWQGPRSIALGGVAGMLALQGDGEGAASVEAELRAERGSFGFLAPELCIGPAWVAAVEGRLPAAHQLLAEGIAEARRTGQRTLEARLCHEAARLGAAASVVDRLDELAAETEGSLVSALASQVRAEVRGDRAALEAAADRLEELGYVLVAAEALACAADLARSEGDQRQATALAGRAATLAEACEGARSPRITPTDAVVPLTAREREIAVLAASGMQSKVIAERLHLSVRTVNNHLQNCYTKLGVGSRRELADALGTDA